MGKGDTEEVHREEEDMGLLEVMEEERSLQWIHLLSKEEDSSSHLV